MTLGNGIPEYSAEETVGPQNNTDGPIEVGRDPKLSDSSAEYSQWAPKDFDPVLECNVEIIQIPKLVKWSEYNDLYHIKSGRNGKLEIQFTASNVPAIESGKNWYLRLELKRNDRKFSHVPVNLVCKNHRQEDKVNAPILPVTTDNRFTNLTEPSGRVSLFYLCQRSFLPNALDGNYISAKFGVYFPCNDSCVNSTQTELFG